MSTRAAGRRWVDLFDKHRSEVRSIFGSDEAIMRQVDSSLRDVMPLVVALADTPLTRGAKIEAEIESRHVDSVMGSLAAVRSKASPELCKDIDELEQEVALYKFVGVDVRAAWETLTGSEQE